MTPAAERIVILMADDDADDRKLARKALAESRLANELHMVENGEELLDYLCRRGAYTDPKTSPRPGVILLDLNMPRKDGRAVLAEIKTDPGLRATPIVIFSTSRAQRDIAGSYALGANSYVCKPGNLRDFTSAVNAICDFWCGCTVLPGERNS